MGQNEMNIKCKWYQDNWIKDACFSKIGKDLIFLRCDERISHLRFWWGSQVSYHYDTI